MNERQPQQQTRTIEKGVDLESLELGTREIIHLAQTASQSALSQRLSANDLEVMMHRAQADGFHPSQATAIYFIISGRMGMMSSALLARFHSMQGKHQVLKCTDTECVIRFMAPTLIEAQDVSYTMEDVRRARANNANFDKYPSDMLFARCVARGIRRVMPGAALGVVVEGELEEEPAYVQRINDAPRASVAAPPAPNLDALPAAAPAPAKAPPAPRPEPQQEDSARPAAIQPPAAALTDAERQKVKQIWSTRPKDGTRADLENWYIYINQDDRKLMDRWASANRDNSDASVKTLANLWASFDIPF